MLVEMLARELIMASPGIGEIWRYDGRKLDIL